MTFHFVICPKSNFNRIKTELKLKFYHMDTDNRVAPTIPFVLLA